MKNRFWYAVQMDRTDAWDNGSHDLGEAVAMLMEQGAGLIAVINEETGVCVEEYYYEDFSEYEDAELPF